MGTLINEHQFQHFLPTTFVYDLEYVGVPNDLNNCYIWDIGVIHLLSGKEFSVTVDPGIRPLPPPMSSEFANVTEEFLQKRNVQMFSNGWSRFIQFIKSFENNNSKILLISHNNFKSDKLMLEIESRRRSLILPYDWYFLDSLLYCRKAIPKQPSYTLHDLYISMMGKTIHDNHSALPDARALREILYRTNINIIHGSIYPSFCTSLQVIKWLGPSCERELFQNNIRSLQQLISNIICMYGNHTLTCVSGPMSISDFVCHFITQHCGIQCGNSKSISNSIVEKWL